MLFEKIDEVSQFETSLDDGIMGVLETLVPEGLEKLHLETVIKDVRQSIISALSRHTDSIYYPMAFKKSSLEEEDGVIFVKYPLKTLKTISSDIV